MGINRSVEKSTLNDYGVKSLVGYSTPSKKILKMYQSIPEADRPAIDLPQTLRALDAVEGVTQTNRHFGENARYHHTYGGIGRRYPLLCEKRGNHCKGYVDLYNTLDNLKDELKDRDLKIGMLGVGSSVEDTLAAIRQEAAVVRSVTRDTLGELQ